MTSNPSTEPNSMNPLTLQITVETPEQKEILAALHTLIDGYTTNTPETRLIEQDEITPKSHDSPCPECGSDEIRKICAREEIHTYNHETETLDYNGLDEGTVVLNGDSIRTYCPQCDAVFKDTPQHHLTDYQTL